ncbi:DNA topoisomerase III [Heliobacterium gestii]|uniref:DNA topoisomerase n=1 Tax=Heliomicrobium gestii TaxID=2699 RepID=A0A845L900_HELGE|nr:type IA DNA topoisomerase [Heliomicrobium gestii]MBM7865460.1 DNA topoisomerase-3 [Heliomicrobium gestii]MZP41714.1 DNA topoisomerase III [Heliomicrobium gestii]
MKILIIAEKPSAAEAIAEAAAGSFQKKRGYLESADYYVTWAVGHLVQLAEPEDYRSSLKRWRFNDLPIIPDFQLRPVKKTESQLKTIASLAKKCRGLINACDAAREGELIFRYIVAYLRLEGMPAWRLWTASLTGEAIRAAMAELQPLQRYDNLFKSARCRSEGDWLIGINATRAFTTRFGELLSLGRVQTPVLAMICENRRRRDAFVPEIYWEVWARFQGDGCDYRGVWLQDKGETRRLSEREKGEAIAAAVNGRQGEVCQVDEKESRELPPRLYDLTTLQRECNRLFGFSASKTLKIAQELYDSKFITYPRTNSRFVDRHGLSLLRRVVSHLANHPVYGPFVARGNPQLVHERNRNICRPEAVEDHHALLPTSLVPSGLVGDKQKVYDRIVRRVLAHYYLPARYRERVVLTAVPDGTLSGNETTVAAPPKASADRGVHLFRSSEKAIVDPGWKVVDGGWAPPKAQERLPERAGLTVRCAGAEVLEKQTEPPKAYTEGSLLAAMETAGKQLDDEELREIMKDAGLGTPATRAATIERLKEVGYIELQGKQIEPTPKGMALVSLVEKSDIPVLLSAEMTGRWEKYLNEIARGNGQPAEFNRRVSDLAVHLVKQLERAEKTWYDKGACARRLATCPRCGGAIVENRKAYACANWKDENCPVTIWKTFRGKRITEKTALALLEKGRSPRLRFYTKEKKPYPAVIVFDAQTGTMNIEFSSAATKSTKSAKATKEQTPKAPKAPRVRKSSAVKTPEEPKAPTGSKSLKATETTDLSDATATETTTVIETMESGNHPANEEKPRRRRTKKDGTGGDGAKSVS